MNIMHRQNNIPVYLLMCTCKLEKILPTSVIKQTNWLQKKLQNSYKLSIFFPTIGFTTFSVERPSMHVTYIIRELYA